MHTPFFPVQPPEVTQVVSDHPVDAPLSNIRLNDLLDDAFRFHDMHNNSDSLPLNGIEDVHQHEGGSGVHIHSQLNMDKEYIELKAASNRPLYSGCKDGHTTLYCMVGLHNIKSQFGLSGNCVTKILLWAKDFLPKDETLPDKYTDMKKTLKGLGMKYKSIHACPLDCILYRG